MNEKRPEFSPKVILGVAAHADDLDFYAAGSMAKWAAAGAKVYYLILTDGGKGTADPNMTSANLVKVRQAEQEAAGKITGITEVFFAKFEDGALVNSAEVKREIVHRIRVHRPDVVVCWDPSFVYSTERGLINHADHRAAGQATLDAVYPMARDRLYYPELLAEGYAPHKVGTVLLMGAANQNFVSDITDQLDTKLEALSAHASQMGSEMEEAVRQLAQDAGRPHNLAAAEAFARIDLEA